MSIDCRKKLFAAMVGASVAEVVLASTPEQLEQVLVTARRTVENAQDVPVALTALSTERLANPDVTSLEKLSALLPEHPAESLEVTLKANAERDSQGGTSWNDRLWKCPAGHGTFPGGDAPQPCGEGFEISQNPVPQDIAATRPDMGRNGGQLYTRYESRGVTAQIDYRVPHVDLVSITNYQHFDYTGRTVQLQLTCSH